MQSFILDQRQGLEMLCRRFEVERLELFGSAAKGAFDDRSSDLDFLVEFRPQGPSQAAHRYFGLLEGLESLFARPIDLVERRAIRNPFFRAEVDRSSQLVYEA